MLSTAKKSLLNKLRSARSICFVMVLLTLSNVFFATLCSAHDVSHAIHPDVVHVSAIDLIQPSTDLGHAFGMQESHCMHSTCVHAPCITCADSVPVMLTARHDCIAGACLAPPSRPNDNLMRPPSFN